VMDLNEAISSRLNMFRRVIREDIDLVFQPASGLWHVRIDPTQLDQILTNLLVNSRDAISGVGRVEIETTNTELDEAFCLHNPELSPGRYVVILVRDNGCGMDAETLPNIFEPFYTTKEQGKGTGLGLATVYGIIHQNNGHILVKSLIGEGTTFTIFLPRVEAELTRQEEKGEPKLPQGGHNLVVLLVEDEIALIDLAIDTLEELGYNVISSTKPLDAVILAQQHTGKIDLLITDVIMPGMNGQLLAERVREIKPEIKCLFMSGYSADIIADQGILPTGVNFIQKPFTLQDLANRVSEVLRLGEG